MEASGSDSGLNKMFEVFKLDRFDGSNFTRWKDKLLFFLTELGIAYLLSSDLTAMPEPTAEDSDEIKAARKKREDDEKYTAVKQGTDRFLGVKFFEFQMIDGKSVMEQVDEKKLLYSSEDFNVDQLTKHIRIEEESRKHENKYAAETSSKVNYVESSKANNSGKSGNKAGKKRKFEAAPKENSSNIKKGPCYTCGKMGHFKSDFRFRKRQKNEENAGQKRVNNVEQQQASSSDIVAMISAFTNLNLSMVTECNMAATMKSADWWYDSGATVHVCNDKSFFKHYEVATSDEKVLMGNHDTAKVFGKGTV
ncbi:hypothetical protein A4A49_57908, partial [Nicotiana attenuata]